MVSFSQSENDAKDIIKLVVDVYKNDTINVFYKFHNQELIYDLSQTEWKKFDLSKIFEECSKKYDTITEKDLFFECINSKFPNDTATFKFEKIKVNYYGNSDLLEKTNDTRIKKIHKTSFGKNIKIKPLSFISFPLISSDKKKAIVYCTFITGSLSGNKGYYILEKINRKWKIVNYEFRGFM